MWQWKPPRGRASRRQWAARRETYRGAVLVEDYLRSDLQALTALSVIDLSPVIVVQ